MRFIMASPAPRARARVGLVQRAGGDHNAALVTAEPRNHPPAGRYGAACGAVAASRSRTRCTVTECHRDLARLLLMSGQPTEALALAQTALDAHEKLLGRHHAWTKDSARVTADALDALGRTEEAKALREPYGVTEPEKP
jgi:hypothetical protein